MQARLPTVAFGEGGPIHILNALRLASHADLDGQFRPALNLDVLKRMPREVGGWACVGLQEPRAAPVFPRVLSPGRMDSPKFRESADAVAAARKVVEGKGRGLIEAPRKASTGRCWR
jgi:hypothetical protein